MGKKLVIVESPAKAKTINKILGADFVVRSSFGHVRDLPVDRFGVDVKNGFRPEYVMVKGRRKAISELVKEAKAADEVYLAPDPDREGEAIAWHLQAILEKAGIKKKFFRVTYNEITPRRVLDAFLHPRELDLHLVDAQQARRVMDRIVGYRVSPLLWSRVRGGSSAGRVQSVALRLVCEREQKVREFVPEDYWLIGAQVRKLVAPLDPFEVRLTRIDGEKAEVKSEEASRAILGDLEGRKLNVVKVASREVLRRPFPPFITSTLQQAASSNFGLSPANTMRVAQRLYEGIDLAGETVGLITYMRTDSVSLAPDAVDACRKFIVENLGADFCPASPNKYASRKGAQGAHEAIRPTDVMRTPESLARYLPPGELRIYRLIWERFVASQMTPARILQRTVDAEAAPAEGRKSSYLFRASSSEVVFPGYMKVSGVGSEKKPADKEEEVERLPPLAEGEPLECLGLLSQKKTTQPPGRFSEASLVRELERNGVGRPSTYAQILSTLSDREYVSKENKALVPTALGIQVNEFLVGNLGELFAVGFTAAMEEELDRVEEGKVNWTSMVQGFHDRFIQWLSKAKGPSAAKEKVERILAALENVQTWDPEVNYGKRVYSDRKFTESVRKQMQNGEVAISERQLAALVRVTVRYESQIPGLKELFSETGLADLAQAVQRPRTPPDALVMRKLEALRNIACEPPTERKGRKYDDRKFIDSFRSQADAGRDLSTAQRRQIDRLLVKYADQIPDFEALKRDTGVVEQAQTRDEEVVTLLELMRHVVAWKAPVKRNEREFNDKDFCESIRQQFDRRGTLSPRQKAVLKKMIVRYRDQIPDYEGVAARHNLRQGSKQWTESAQEGQG